MRYAAIQYEPWPGGPLTLVSVESLVAGVDADRLQPILAVIASALVGSGRLGARDLLRACGIPFEPGSTKVVP